MDDESPIRILVIEDDDDTAFMIKSLLVKKFAAVVDISNNCASGRHKLTEGEYDVVTLDYQLPDCDGLDMLDEITAIKGHPPVVMITGHGDEELAYLSFRMGASGYASKDRKLPVMLGEAVEWALAQAAGTPPTAATGPRESSSRDAEARMRVLASEMRIELGALAESAEKLAALARAPAESLALDVDESVARMRERIERADSLVEQLERLAGREDATGEPRGGAER